MRRVLLVATVAALMAAMIVVSSGAASANSGSHTDNIEHGLNVVQDQNSVFVSDNDDEAFDGISSGGLDGIDDLLDGIDNDGID